MSRGLMLSPADLAVLIRTLRAHLSPDVAVWAFGSRTTGDARQYSDLDLALRADRPIEWTVIARLKDALSESDLTMKVDVIDLRAIDPAFRDKIEPDLVPLHFAAAHS